MPTFGSRLKTFAQATDIVPEKTFRALMTKILNYLKNNLGAIDSIIIAVQEVDCGREYLIGAWPPERIARLNRSYRLEDGTYWRKPIFESDRSYCGQSSYVYTKRKPGWFVAADKGSLEGAKSYEDLLHNHIHTEIPPFVPALNGEFKTSVIFPLHVHDGIFGIVNFEFKEYVTPNAYWTKDLAAVADAIAILFQLHKSYLLQMHATDLAVLELDDYDLIPKGDPIALLLTSSNADREVRGIIKTALGQYNKHFRLVDWADLLQPTDIAPEIRKLARNAVLGFAYLSEPSSQEKGHNYQDNANVIYELGLLHGIQEVGITPLKGVVILRESSCPPPPFDYSGIRRIVVERSEDGKLNPDRLYSEIGRTILGIDKSWIPRS